MGWVLVVCGGVELLYLHSPALRCPPPSCPIRMGCFCVWVLGTGKEQAELSPHPVYGQEEGTTAASPSLAVALDTARLAPQWVAAGSQPCSFPGLPRAGAQPPNPTLCFLFPV